MRLQWNISRKRGLVTFRFRTEADPLGTSTILHCCPWFSLLCFLMAWEGARIDAIHVSLHRHIKHFFRLANRWFQTHYSFMFLVFNLLQCQQILLHSSLKMNHHNFDVFKAQFSQVSPSAVRTVAK